MNFCHIDALFLQAWWVRFSVACKVISQLVLHTFLKTTLVRLTAFFFKIYSSINHTFSENTKYHTVTGAVPFQKVLYNIYSLGTNMYF